MVATGKTVVVDGAIRDKVQWRKQLDVHTLGFIEVHDPLVTHSGLV